MNKTSVRSTEGEIGVGGEGGSSNRTRENDDSGTSLVNFTLQPRADVLVYTKGRRFSDSN